MRIIDKIKFFIAFMLFMPFLLAFTPDNTDNNNANIVYQHKKNEYSRVTKDPRIISALDCMVGTTGEYSRNAILGSNVTGRAIRIEFKDLTKFSKAFSTFDALGKKKGKQLYIYISTRHYNAPPEALGSLLSHEALHQDDFNSKDEETYAWTFEADVWLQMKKRNPKLESLQSDPFSLITRENTLGELFVEGNYSDEKIRALVESNPAYRDFPQRSPGFDNDD